MRQNPLILKEVQKTRLFKVDKIIACYKYSYKKSIINFDCSDL